METVRPALEQLENIDEAYEDLKANTRAKPALDVMIHGINERFKREVGDDDLTTQRRVDDKPQHGSIGVKNREEGLR